MLEIITLGGLEIRLGGRPVVSPANHKAGALLCYLAVAGQSRSRAALAGLLWGEATESNARAYLRQALALLRREVAAHVTITHHEVAFNRQAPYWLDVEAFEEGLRRAAGMRESPLTSPLRQAPLRQAPLRQAPLRQAQGADAEGAHAEGAGAEGTGAGGAHTEGADAEWADLLAGAVDLYRGDFLAGFHVRRAPAFEEWALVERERLRLAALRALGALADHYAASGDLTAALATTQRLLAIEPADEVYHRKMMGLLARDGQRGAALRQYQLCRRAGRAELGPGAQPGEETTALYERIRAAQGRTRGEGLAPYGLPHNLPAALTPLIGRAAELADITSRLQDLACRLLTLTGPGGVGKTHLALAAARLLAGQGGPDRFDDGLYFVRLGPLESLEAVVSGLAGSLGLNFHKQGALRQQLLDYLREKRLLLVLDRFEHLLTPPAPRRGASPPVGGTEGGQAADLVTDILQAAPGVKALVTSRVRLNLGYEHLFPLDGLSCPDGTPSKELESASAVRLFVARARQVAPRFRPTADDLAAITRVCRHVEGSPLGIILAAGWSRTLSPVEIAARLADEISDQDGHGLDLLETDWRDLPARQRGMRAVFEQSWNLLDARQREVFAALSVFRGGFTARAARQVAGATLRELTALVDRSLLQTTAPGRYAMHDLLRAYAAEKLEGRACGSTRDRHCAHYADRLQRWVGDLKGPRQAATLAEMALDIENARAAWDWAAGRGQVAQLDQAIEALCYFYKWRGRYHDGEQACRLAAEGLSAAGEDRGRVLARALAWQGVFSYRLGLVERAGRLFAQSLNLLGEAALTDQDTRRARAFILRRRGDVVMHADRERAQELYEESLALYRALGDEWGTANVLMPWVMSPGIAAFSPRLRACSGKAWSCDGG